MPQVGFRFRIRVTKTALGDASWDERLVFLKADADETLALAEW